MFVQVLRHDKAVLHPVRQMEHLKVVPEYLVPLSMRGLTGNSNETKRNKKRNRSEANYNDNSAERKMQKSKMNDPLYGGDGDDAGEFNVAGRNAWKIRHNKGKYNPKNPQGAGKGRKGFQGKK